MPSKSMRSSISLGGFGFSFLSLSSSFGLSVVFFVVLAGAVVARRERIVEALAQRQREDLRVAVRREVPFDVRQLRRPFAVAEVIEVFAVRRERRRIRVELRVADVHALGAGEIAHVELRELACPCR